MISTDTADTPEMLKARDLCLDFANRFESAKRNGMNMLITGGCGTGKTHLAASIIKAIVRHGNSAKYKTASTVSTIAKESRHFNSTEPYSKLIDRLCGYDLLVVDEVGYSDADKLALFDIVNARYSEVKPTILISNLDVAGLESEIGVRILDRLRHNGVLLSLNWRSYR